MGSYPTTPVQSELVALLQALKIPQAASPRDNIGYRENYTNANAQDHRLPFCRGIYRHNCREGGHYSTGCTRPVVSGAQINELQGDPRQSQEDQARCEAYRQLELRQRQLQVMEERENSNVLEGWIILGVQMLSF